MTTTLPTTPAAPRVDLELAAVLDRAADIIDTNGLNCGKFFGDDSDVYDPGMPCCTVGAIGVALGLRYTTQLVDMLGADDDRPAHPAIRALMRHERLHSWKALYEWSDTAEQGEVVAALQDTAAELRGERP